MNDSKQRPKAAPVTPPPMAPDDEAPAGTVGTGEAICPMCDGSGSAPSSEGACPNCQGTGRVIVGVGGA